MNYATTVDPVLSVRPLYDQGLHCMRIEGANSISEKNVCTCCSGSTIVAHIIKSCFYYLEGLLLFLCWVISKYG